MPIKERYRKNPEKYIEETRQYCQRNKDKVKKSRAVYYHLHKKNNEEKKREYAKKHYLKNKDKFNERSRLWHEKNRDRDNKKALQNYYKNREKYLKKRKEKYQEMRIEVIKHYSKERFECNCCGEKHIEFLTIDHINNNGAEHRKEIKKSNIIQWLYKNEFPPGFQVLCFNCNCAKGIYGYCPHEK